MTDTRPQTAREAMMQMQDDPAERLRRRIAYAVTAEKFREVRDVLHDAEDPRDAERFVHDAILKAAYDAMEQYGKSIEFSLNELRARHDQTLEMLNLTPTKSIVTQP